MLELVMGLPAIANIVVGVGVEHANGIHYRWFKADHAEGDEPYVYVESRGVKGYLYLQCVAYTADDSEIGRWTLIYGVGQGFVGVRFADILIHGELYGADISLLPGDVNADFEVNLIDVAAVVGHNGEAVNSSNCRFDLNLDGEINLIDKAKVKSLAGG